MTLTEKIALVTGAARGIGRAIAARLAKEGATVVCADMVAADETVDVIRAAGGAAEAVALDVTDSAAAREAVEGVVVRHGSLDILVNHAGITGDGLAVRMSVEQWRRVLTVNLDGAFHLCQPAARAMMRQRSGRIVNIASVVGLMGNAGQANYAASKAGLIGLTKSLARELGSRGVTVNAVAPGFIQTAMTDALDERQRDALLQNLLISRLGEPEDIAAAVAFLAGPDASYITGAVINVSGGLYL